MGKTRAEIQKAYRERKKASDPSFLAKERVRQKNYRVPASEKTKKQLKLESDRNKIYCQTYRLKQKALHDQAQINVNESVHEELAVNPPTQSQDITSSSEASTSTRSSNSRLIVQIPFRTRKTPSKKRSKALRQARCQILELKAKVKETERSSKRWQKRCERLKQKTKSVGLQPESISQHLSHFSDNTHPVNSDSDTHRVSSDSDTHRVSSDSDTHRVSSDSDTPLVNSADGTPLVNSADDNPLSNSADDTLLVTSAAEAPRVNSAADTPQVNSAADTPLVNAANTPLVNPADDTHLRNSADDAHLLQTPKRNTATDYLTPRTQTISDLRKDGISPSTLPKSVVRKLVVNECLVSEIRSARKENTSQKHQKLINRIISGKIVKRYRCAKSLKTALGISRLDSGDSKKIIDFKRKRLPVLRKQVSDKVVEFYNRDDISRMMPGKKDSIGVRDAKQQKRILNDYLANTYERFCTEEPNVKLSFSAFCKLRPPYIKLTSLLSRNTCLCTIHQNMALKLKCLRRYGCDISPNPEVIKKQVTLEEMKHKLETIKEQEIEYEEWQRVEVDGKKKTRIVKVKKSRDEFLEVMESQFSIFLSHVSRVTSQYKALIELKRNLPENHIIAQMDFAENFSCASMDEIQSAYWNATSVTLHPVVVYKKVNDVLIHKNFVFISDLNNHNSTAVYAILHILIPLLKDFCPGVETVHYWTDSPSSQYRNRYILNIILRHEEIFGIEGRWNYFEAGHGKGPCDGVGGVCKRMASEAIKQGKTNIQDAAEFHSWALISFKTVEPCFYSAKEYDDAAKFLSTLPPKPIQGTMKLHAAFPQKGILFIRDVSCYCENCINGWKLCEGWSSVNGKSQTSVTLGKEAIDVSTSVGPEGSYVAAFYDDDWFVGKILELDDDEREAFISFMTKHTNKGKLTLRWPERVDEILVPYDKIICKLSEPTPIGRCRRFYSITDADSEIIRQKLNDNN